MTFHVLLSAVFLYSAFFRDMFVLCRLPGVGLKLFTSHIAVQLTTLFSSISLRCQPSLSTFLLPLRFLDQGWEFSADFSSLGIDLVNRPDPLRYF